MMRAPLTWLSPLTMGVVCLAAGLLAGYSLPRSRQAAGEKDKEAHVAAVHAEAKAPTSDQPKAKYAFTFPKTSPNAKKQATPGVLQSLPPAANRQARQEWLQSLTPDNLAKLLEELCQSAGPSGLDYKEKGLVNNALREWWQKDSNGLLAWLGKLPRGGSKNYLLNNLLEWLAARDSRQATALAENFKAQDPEWDNTRLLNRLVDREAQAAWEKPGVTAEEMLAIYSRAGRGRNCTGVHRRTYPLDFDYRKFLDGMASLNRQDGKSPAIMPPDILDAWAKADPEAAIRWLVDYEENKSTKGEVPFVDWQNIVGGVTARSGPRAYHQWAATIVTQSDAKLRNLVIQQSRDADIVGIAQQIGNAAQRDEVFASAIKNGRYGRDEINLLGLVSTPEARLKVIVDNHGRDWVERGKADPSFLQKVGLTKEQLDAAVAERVRR
jgi:hypothetical protein